MSRRSLSFDHAVQTLRLRGFRRAHDMFDLRASDAP